MQPHRFQPGADHLNWKGGRRVTRGHVLVHAPQHHRANVKGYVFEHIVIAETAIGRHLPEGAVIHHANEDGTDNRNSNLAILPDQGYHAALHGRLRVLRAGGNPWTDRWCGGCQRALPASAFYETSEGVCMECRRATAKAGALRSRSEYHPHSTFSDEDVLAIRTAVANGAKQVDVAKRYGVDRSVICNIVNRKRFKSVH